MKKRILPLLLIIVPLPFSVIAATVEEKGLEIAREADRRDSGFGDTAADIVMVLRNRAGDESIRYLRSRILEDLDQGDKTLITFDQPRDIKGTALLTYTQKTKADDQWLYMPSLKRVKRVSSANKSGPFVGSEFAYEDMTSQEVEKYTYKYLHDEELESMDCFVIERFPLDRKSGYHSQRLWLDKEHYRILKIVFYDRKRTLLKTLTLTGYKQYLGHYWRAEDMYMVNHQTGKSTRMLWKDFRFRNGFTDRDFNRNSLKRAG